MGIGQTFVVQGVRPFQWLEFRAVYSRNWKESRVGTSSSILIGLDGIMGWQSLVGMIALQR